MRCGLLLGRAPPSVEAAPQNKRERHGEDHAEQDENLDALRVPRELAAGLRDLRGNHQQAPHAGDQANDQKRFDDQPPLLDRDPDGVQELGDDEQDKALVEHKRDDRQRTSGGLHTSLTMVVKTLHSTNPPATTNKPATTT